MFELANIRELSEERGRTIRSLMRTAIVLAGGAGGITLLALDHFGLAGVFGGLTALALVGVEFLHFDLLAKIEARTNFSVEGLAYHVRQGATLESVLGEDEADALVESLASTKEKVKRFQRPLSLASIVISTSVALTAVVLGVIAYQVRQPTHGWPIYGDAALLHMFAAISDPEPVPSDNGSKGGDEIGRDNRGEGDRTGAGAGDNSGKVVVDGNVGNGMGDLGSNEHPSSSTTQRRLDPGLTGPRVAHTLEHTISGLNDVLNMHDTLNNARNDYHSDRGKGPPLADKLEQLGNKLTILAEDPNISNKLRRKMLRTTAAANDAITKLKDAMGNPNDAQKRQLAEAALKTIFEFLNEVFPELKQLLDKLLGFLDQMFGPNSGLSSLLKKMGSQSLNDALSGKPLGEIAGKIGEMLQREMRQVTVTVRMDGSVTFDPAGGGTNSTPGNPSTLPPSDRTNERRKGDITAVKPDKRPESENRGTSVLPPQ